jgi:hypothetical protein
MVAQYLRASCDRGTPIDTRCLKEQHQKIAKNLFHMYETHMHTAVLRSMDDAARAWNEAAATDPGAALYVTVSFAGACEVRQLHLEDMIALVTDLIARLVLAEYERITFDAACRNEA